MGDFYYQKEVTAEFDANATYQNMMKIELHQMS